MEDDGDSDEEAEIPVKKSLPVGFLDIYGLPCYCLHSCHLCQNK